MNGTFGDTGAGGVKATFGGRRHNMALDIVSRSGAGSVGFTSIFQNAQPE